MCFVPFVVRSSFDNDLSRASICGHNDSRFMADKPGLMQYLTAAFNARPFGMFVAPNWMGLAAVGLLGLINPGFWVLGAGLEIGYLLALATNSRFRRIVDMRQLSGEERDWTTRIAQGLADLDPRDRQRYQAIADRCRSILDLQTKATGKEPAGLDQQQEGLGRLTWMYLRLLIGRQAIQKVLTDVPPGSPRDLATSIAGLETRLAGVDLTDELRRSLEGQVSILRQRIERRGEADRQMAYIDAELTRIEQQVELIREQAALSTDPTTLSQRIDEIAATLGGTSQWIRDQQRVFGAMEDLLTDAAPPTLKRDRAKETQ